MAWRDYIGKDTGWKLFSLLLAILIWGSIRSVIEDGIPMRRGVVNPLNTGVSSGASRMSDPISRAVTVLRAPGDQNRYRVTPPVVDVVVQGDAARLQGLDEAEVRVFVDTAEFAAHRDSTAAGVACAIHVHTPPGVSFAKAEPSAVLVERLPTATSGPPQNPKP